MTARKLMMVLALGLATVAVGAASVAVAGDDETGGEVGIMVGLTQSDDDLNGRVGESVAPEFGFGLRGGAVLHRNWGWFVDGLFTGVDTAAGLGDADVLSARTGMDFLFNPGRDNRWFATFGIGWSDVDYGAGTGADDFQYSFASYGVGRRILVDGRMRFRWELRADRSFDDEGPFNDTIVQVHALGTLQWGPGGAPADSDADGVNDRRDRCPGTPIGAIVDTEGCPLDGDGDGVFDGLDRCPDTPAGWPVDADGCAIDTDDDGVLDGEDDCPDTPRGATVDARGCPSDSDGDGVPDGLDACPDTPRGAVVDERGCPLDEDGDGVFDGLDRCPGTPAGVAVDATGCTLDSDGDGVRDDRDRCPGTPRGTAVDADGCPEAKLFEEGRRSLVLEGVTFELDSAVLTAGARERLDVVARSLLDWPSVRVEIGGHSDSTGSDRYNLQLSEKRAQSVRDYLISRGVPAEQLTATGYGESRPIADNDSKQGRAINRRVELTRLD